MRKIICFHNPDEPNGYLGNWYLSAFELDGISYSSMEQYMMYQKAVLFGDDDIARQILETSDVGKIKALGRMVKVTGYGTACGSSLYRKACLENSARTKN